jgi:hypothetical protein
VLNQFLREVHAFKLDHSHEVGHVLDKRIDGFHFGLENILGNPATSIMIPERMGPWKDGPGGPFFFFFFFFFSLKFIVLEGHSLCYTS